MPARIDQIERIEITPDIQRESMPSHALLDSNAHRTNLSLADPAAGCTIAALRSNPIRRTGIDQRPFKRANVFAQRDPPCA